MRYVCDGKWDGICGFERSDGKFEWQNGYVVSVVTRTNDDIMMQKSGKETLYVEVEQEHYQKHM